MVTRSRSGTDEEQVLAANRAFYDALRSLDIAQMEKVWLQEDWVRCVHPGWELLLGWEDVQKSWEDIFHSSGQMLISVSRPLVQVVGDTAWVSCLADITTAQKDGFSTGLIETTNIFVRREGRWLLVHHHTTPLSRGADSSSNRVVQ
jgi:ketosteroid isomerase-like protein